MLNGRKNGVWAINDIFDMKRILSLLSVLITVGVCFGQIELVPYRTSAMCRLYRPMVVFNNWSAYDELSDTIPQTEQLCMDLLEQVIRLKKNGVQIDCYMMDAFWFDVNGGYRQWDRKNWPDGPAGWLKKCSDNGIVPGLWFSTNLISSGGKPMLLPVNEWKSSVEGGAAIVSLSTGGYLNHLMGTLQQYVDMGVGVFKFDFAYFDAAIKEVKDMYTPSEIEQNNRMALINALKLFRAKNPNVMIIAYNGFGGDMENTFSPYRKTIDLRWLEVFDTIYSGDPRFSDVPMMNLWRSEDLYSDHMVKQFAYNGMPLKRIDNCSFMIGNTGTCYNRGIEAWKSSMILNMARSGWLNVCHGNIDLLSDADAQWMAKAQRLYLPLQQFGHTELVGGIPGMCEVYGYKSEDKYGVLYTVVNPKQEVVHIDLKGKKGEILFTDKGFKAKFTNGILVLGPEQMAVVGFGEYNRDKYSLGLEEDVVIPQAIEQMEFKKDDVDIHRSTCRFTAIKGKYRILFSQTDRSGNPFRSWGGGLPDGKNMAVYFKFSVNSNGRGLDTSIQYDKVIWSGLSWAAAEFEVPSPGEVSVDVYSKEGTSSLFKINIYRVTY